MLLSRRKFIIGASVTAPLVLIRRPALSWNKHGIAGSGYNNLINWPAVDNRPALSGGVLSWIGPVGGGPSTANDVAQQVTLTAHNADITTGSNQTISGLALNNHNITIDGDNVLITQCEVGNIFVGNVNTNITVEDCYVNGTFDGAPNGNVSNLMCRRNNMFGSENLVNKYINTSTFIDNWLHAMSGADCDGIELDGDSDNVTIQHNTISGLDFGSGFLNAGVNLTNFNNESPPPANLNVGPTIALTNNAFLSCGTFFNICDDSSQGSGFVKFSATNNGFYGALAYRRDTANGATAISPNTGNFIMNSVTDTSGALVNGTGAI